MRLRIRRQVLALTPAALAVVVSGCGSSARIAAHKEHKSVGVGEVLNSLRRAEERLCGRDVSNSSGVDISPNGEARCVYDKRISRTSSK